MKGGTLSPTISSKINTIINTFTKNNLPKNLKELEKILQSYGYGAYRHLLKLLLTDINFKSINQKDIYKLQLLTKEFSQLSMKSNFVSFILELIEEANLGTAEYLSNLSKTLKLTLQQQVLLGMAMVHTNKPSLVSEGIKFLGLIKNDIKEKGPAELDENLVHHLLYLTQLPDFKDKNEILLAFKPKYENHKIISVFYGNKKESNSVQTEVVNTKPNVSGIIKEIGYSCLSTEENFTILLKQFPNIDESDFGMIIGMMATCHTGLNYGVDVLKSFFVLC